MPAQTQSATAGLLPSIDYSSPPVRAFRPAPDPKLVVAPTAPPASEPERRAAPAPPPLELATDTEPPPGDRRLAALQSLTEEEIIALFS